MVHSAWMIEEIVHLAAPVGQRFYQPELDGLTLYAFLSVYALCTLPSVAEFYRGSGMPALWLGAAVVKSGGAGVGLFFALRLFSTGPYSGSLCRSTTIA
jgi:hypothetical protein